MRPGSRGWRNPNMPVEPAVDQPEHTQQPLTSDPSFSTHSPQAYSRADSGSDSTVGHTHNHTMHQTNDEFDRLERLIYRPVSTRPDWLKAWRNEAQYLLYLARRAVDDDDDELVQELEQQARDMADIVEARLLHDGLL